MSCQGGMKEIACPLQRDYCQEKTDLNKLANKVWFSTSLGAEWVKD